MQASSFLEGQLVEEPRANAELLLMHVLGMDRAALLRDYREPFPPERAAEWERLIRRKAAGEPVQYITGEQWFYGRPFRVTPAVLIPRPETELLVEAVLEAAAALWPPQPSAPSAASLPPAGLAGADAGEAAHRAATDAPPAALPGTDGAAGPAHAAPSGVVHAIGADFAAADGRVTVLDVGAGSGAISVSLAAERTDWRVCASDLSPDALQAAQANAAVHGAERRMAFVEGDLLAPFISGGGSGSGVLSDMAVDVLVSNPPYIPAGDLPGLQREVRDYEPRLALDGGQDGLDPYRRMVQQLPLLKQMPRIVAFELGIRQAQHVAGLLEAMGCWSQIRIIPDYAGIDRHVMAVR
ncbi:HemK family protein methyltransferase [Paenibacillus protaetiae]|uniref:Release factor glutamine methyltransferase n=2 Tax=Paenibacillus protaetiae TaxID=2509456 RepID=A0A4P6F328_9BACL|nr:HemK family protein methyltransferase [Paenibacillus protaetiae]